MASNTFAALDDDDDLEDEEDEEEQQQQHTRSGIDAFETLQVPLQPTKIASHCCLLTGGGEGRLREGRRGSLPIHWGAVRYEGALTTAGPAHYWVPDSQQAGARAQETLVYNGCAGTPTPCKGTHTDHTHYRLASGAHCCPTSLLCCELRLTVGLRHKDTVES